MNIARETYYLYMRNLKARLGQPGVIVATLVPSVFMFLFFGAPLSGMVNIPGFPADDYDAYITGMIIVMAVVMNGADSAFTMLTDMMSGYFDKLLLAPVNRFSILMGTLLVSGTRSMLQVVVIIALALLLGVRFESGLLGLAVVILLASIFGIATACIGMIIALKTKNVQATQNSFLMFMPLAFLTTGLMPQEFLTGWFKWAVAFNPVNYVLVSVRTIIVDGWVWESILPGFWVLAATTVIMVSAATWTYKTRNRVIAQADSIDSQARSSAPATHCRRQRVLQFHYRCLNKETIAILTSLRRKPESSGVGAARLVRSALSLSNPLHFTLGYQG